MGADVEGLEDAAGYRFERRDLLVRAMTHKSYVHEKFPDVESGISDNEQLEFLGDSILGFLVSERLMRQYPRLSEGRLSKLRAHLVSASHLHEVARRIDVGRYLLLGRGEELSGGRDKKALLADALEALIAAIFLDGGIEATRQFVTRHIVVDSDRPPGDDGMPMNDFKSALQEFAQARKLPQPRYVIVKQRGPEHAKYFTVEVRIGEALSAQAEARSKKSAGQMAAQVLLERLTEDADSRDSGDLLQDFQNSG